MYSDFSKLCTGLLYCYTPPLPEESGARDTRQYPSHRARISSIPQTGNWGLGKKFWDWTLVDYLQVCNPLVNPPKVNQYIRIESP